MDTIRALLRIEEEIATAETLFPDYPRDPVHAAAIVAEEAGELVRAALRFCYENGSKADLLLEATQTGAAAVRFLRYVNFLEPTRAEQIDTREVKKSDEYTRSE